MLTLLQIGIHRAPREWPSLPELVFLRSLKNLFKPRARIGIVENFSALFEHDLIDNFGHDVKVVESVHRAPGLAPGEIAGRPTAILGRTGLVAIGAKRIDPFGDGLQTLFEPNLVAPRNVQIVFVGEARALAKAQPFQRHSGD